MAIHLFAVGQKVAIPKSELGKLYGKGVVKTAHRGFIGVDFIDNDGRKHYGIYRTDGSVEINKVA